VVAEGATQQLLKMRRQDQQRAMQRLREDPGLSGLQLVEGPLLDLEVRGLPALQYFGGVVWK
jgi:arsenite-transporting ATPase